MVQIEGNPIGGNEEASDKSSKSSEVGSDSGVASQEEEMSERKYSNKTEIENLSENSTKNVCRQIETSGLNNDGLMVNVRF